jgi:hypothetical protein
LVLLFFLLINPKGLVCKENGSFLGFEETERVAVEEDKLFPQLLLLLLSLFCFLFLFKKFFGLNPKESSLILLLFWSFFHILLSNNCSLKVCSELSFENLDSIFV